MFRFIRIAAATVFVASSTLFVVRSEAHATEIDDALGAVLSASLDPAESHPVLIYFERQADLDAIRTQFAADPASRANRHALVVESLRAAQTQSVNLANAIGAIPGVTNPRHFWLTNAVAADATGNAIDIMTQIPGVRRVFLDPAIGLIRPVSDEPNVKAMPHGPSYAGGPEAGLATIRVPETWALGFRGQGMLIAGIDSGVDGAHPALNESWAGTLPAYNSNPEWAWFDPFFGLNDFPYDDNLIGHGTHTMGTMVGIAPGEEIGVAPDAHWIAAGAIDRGGDNTQTIADAIEAFEWVMNPDGNPSTMFDVPHVVNCSWGLTTGLGFEPCDALFWTFLDAIEDAGTLVVFAAGNEGAAGGLRRPADRAASEYRTLAVGAVNQFAAGNPIAPFSSRGPVICTPDGLPAVKPDIAAPGVNVRSALPGGSYGTKDGTSMASPHIAGAALLVMQANPDLTVDQVKSILYQTAEDLGDAGADNDYGRGLVDVFAAVQLALDTTAMNFDVVGGIPSLINPAGQFIRVDVARTNADAGDAAIAARVVVRIDGGPWQSFSMNEVGADRWQVTLPEQVCGGEAEWYVEADAPGGGTARFPFDAPDGVLSATVATSTEFAIETDFETVGAWTVSNGAVTGGAWELGVPNGAGDRGDPVSDYDGSGACWLTENGPGNTDVDGGPAYLISPVVDVSDMPEAFVEYARWISRDDDDLDNLSFQISFNGGVNWQLVEVVEDVFGWTVQRFRIADFGTPNSQLRFRFAVIDNPNDSVVEAAVDAFRVGTYRCDPTFVAADIDGDGFVGFADLVAVLASWGPCDGCAADVNGDGVVAFQDVVSVLAAWTG